MFELSQNSPESGFSPSADHVLEELWRAAVTGIPPDAPDILPSPVAILRDRMKRDAPPDWQEAAKFIEGGARLQAAGDRSGALHQFGAAYAHTAPSTTFFLQIASSYLAAGDFERAERWLRRKAGEVGGGSDVDTYVHLAHAIWGAGRYREALAICDRLIERFPSHLAAIDTAALMHTERGDPARALDACVSLLLALPADQPVPADLARRATLAAVRLGTILPGPVIDRIAALAATSGDNDLSDLVRKIAVQSFAQRNWSDLFSDGEQAFADPALTAPERATLKELLDIERSAPVIGLKDTVAFERYYDLPAVEPNALVAEGTALPSSKSATERALMASDLSSTGLLATQISIVAAGNVTMLSPFGGVVQSSTSVVLNYHPSLREYGSVIAYYFSGPRPLFVFFATEDNWPVAWYDPVAHLILCYDDVIEEFTAYLQDRVRELKLSCLADPSATHRYLSAAASRAGKPPTLLTGMLDYLSTHLFADLQGLKRFVERLPGSAIEALIVAAPEPFGPIEELLPELRGATILRDIPDDAVLFNHQLWRDNRMIARITGCMVEQPLADRLIARAKRFADPAWRNEVDELRAAGRSILFVSLRAHNRRWLASAEAIAGVLNRLHDHHPDLAIVFDGHCLGGTPPSQNLVDRENAMIAGVIDHLHAHVRYLVSAGRTMADSLYAATSATIHLSAQGTSATKAVLIAGLPGVVVGSRQFGWIVTAFRSPCPETITLSEFSTDAEEGNIQCDFSLDPDIVCEGLLRILALDADTLPAA